METLPHNGMHDLMEEFGGGIIIHDDKRFSEKLVDWNMYNDCKRRHHSLERKSPLQYFVDIC